MSEKEYRRLYKIALVGTILMVLGTFLVIIQISDNSFFDPLVLLSGCCIIFGAALSIEHLMTKWYLDDPKPLFPNHEYIGLILFITGYALSSQIKTVSLIPYHGIIGFVLFIIGFCIGVFNSKYKKILEDRWLKRYVD